MDTIPERDGLSVLVPSPLAGLAADLGEMRDWTDQALCAQTDPEIFFPEKGGSVRAPKLVCRSCEVRAECLDYALTHRISWGVWGGLTERERRRLRRRAAA